MHPLLYRRDTNWVTRRSTFLESKTSSWHQLGGEGYPRLLILLLGLIGYPGIMPGGRWAAVVGWREGNGLHITTFNAPADDL